MGKLDTPLCLYRYDALDQLVGLTPALQANTRRFYAQDKLATEIRGQESHTIIQHADQLLAQQRRQSTTVNTSLLLADRHRSILHILDTQAHLLNYTPYGYRPVEHRTSSLLEFNGERRDPVTGHYLLGNGYRAFNPILKRFNSPDNMSPFGKGGLNPYAYCMGDPVNYSDPSGHFIGGLVSLIGAFSTKMTAAFATGVNLMNGVLLARVGGTSVGLATSEIVSSFTAAVATGLAFSPVSAQAALYAARPIAQAALVTGGAIAITKLAPRVWARIPLVVRETLRSERDIIRVAAG